MEVSEILIFTEIALCFLGTLCKDIMAVEPRFDVPIVNITVVAGKTAVLPCSIESLGEFKVVWTDQYSTLLTLAEKRIIDDERMVLDRPHTKDWNLLLHDVKYEDRGRYTCQINTLPIKTKTIELIVLVPPEILDTSSNDLTTKEGDTVTLTCNVTGIPRPTVQWFRKPHADSQEHHKERVKTTTHGHYGNQLSDDHCLYTVSHRAYEVQLPSAPIATVIGHDPVVNNGVGINGEILIIHNVSRYCDGIYECVAFNDVPPAVNRVISVMVEFPPEVWLNNKKMSQSLGKETILECKVTAFPQAVSVWRFENVFLANSLKHRIDIYKDKGHTIILSVRIMNITKEDFGQYSCFASNEFGEDEETMTLLEFNPPTKPRPVTTTEVRIFTTTPKTRSKLKSSEYDDFIPFKRNEGISHNRGNETFVDGLQFGIKCTGAIVRICAPYSMGKSNAGQTSLYYNGKLLISLIILFNFIIDIFYLV
ncbi:opioid-binding protein/cell adhesion molecule-like isoform X2 [Ostrea edulis]|uniref:opioid-binding protein/cell adhesion molecule-like isoform X2 n=1 Tax=Ostrea edulis TaxID=37623 RepID=UPI0020958134|nr:opioid-binding protein/cell adhesion molecule-like isoform X2 [Ostrea edulis]